MFRLTKKFSKIIEHVALSFVLLNAYSIIENIEKMKNRVLNVLRGKFLVSNEAPKNWLFIIFVSLLAAVMIGSSHSADKKVHQIATLNEEVKELRNEYFDLHKDVQRMKLESKITQVLQEEALFPSEFPPQKIKVKSQQTN